MRDAWERRFVASVNNCSAVQVPYQCEAGQFRLAGMIGTYIRRASPARDEEALRGAKSAVLVFIVGLLRTSVSV
jgi:hypothetical protein